MKLLSVPYVVFLAKAIKAHGSTYRYPSLGYVTMSKPCTIICSEHGPFTQVPSQHILGAGCKHCADRRKAEKRVANASSMFEQKAIIKHGDIYDYSQVIYKGRREKVDIMCRLHGVFRQTVANHLQGAGCKECASNMKKFKANIDPTTGWILYYPKRPTILYYVRFTYKRKYYYKIGITTQGIQKRFASEPIPYEVLWSKEYKSGKTAYDKEQKILSDSMEYRYFGPNILKSGNSELRTQDIMK